MLRSMFSVLALAASLCAPGCKSGLPADSGAGRGAYQAILERSDLPRPMAEPAPGDPLAVTVHRLDNGLTVYISPNPEEPRVSAWIAVRAGSRHDPAESTGLAHYLEHMLFKGTDELGTLDAAAEAPHIERIAALYDQLQGADDDQRGRILAEIDAETQAAARYAIPNELDQLYARLGITGVNAFTSDEQTVYIADVPRNRFEAFIQVEAERFRDPVFRLFYPELESVYEEKNISLDRPIIRVLETLYANLFPAHPYGTQPTIGLVEHLKTPAYGDMEAYFARWYVPNNMAIVLAGDIDARTALPVIEKYFGSLAPKPLEPPAPGRIAPVAGRKQVALTASGESAVYMGWVTAPVAHEDAPALEVIDLLMDNEATGLIKLDLVLSQELPSAGSFIQLMRESGTWMMYGIARQDQSLDEVEALLWKVHEKLRSGAFTQADLDAIVLHQEMAEMRQSESNDARVARIAHAYVHHIPWPEAARHSDKLRRVTRAEVMAAARKYLGRDNVVVVRRQNGEHVPPKVPKPTITPIDIDPSRKSAFAAAIEALPAEDIAPEWLEAGKHYQRLELGTGPMIAVENTRNRLFSVSYEYELGTRAEPLLCFAVQLMEQSGFGDLGPDAVQRKLYAMGSKLETRCGPDQVVLTLEGIDEHFDDSVRLLSDWLTRAALDEGTRAKLAANEISLRKDMADNPDYLGRALMYFAGMGESSEYLHEPSNQMLRDSQVATLAGLLARLAQTRHHTRYFGPRDAGEAARSVALGTGRHAPEPRPPRRYRDAGASRIFFLHKEMAQARMAIFIPEPPLAHEVRPRALLYSEYVGGGMGALIFQEMREARGLAYSAWAGFMAGQRAGDQASLVGVVGTQADKSLDALTTMLELLRDLPLDDARLGTAKSALEAEYRSKRIDPRDIAGQVHGWDELGLATDPRPGYWQAIDAMDGPALAAFARRFADKPLIISVLGDRSRIDLGALGRIAPIEEVSVARIFSY